MAVMDRAFDPRWGEAWNARQVADALATPNTHSLLAAPDGSVAEDGVDVEQHPAGFLLSRAAGSEEELLLLGVAPPFRNRGIGRALVTRFIAEARLRGAEKLFLEMRVNNEADRFYRQLGFVPIGRRPSYYRIYSGGYLDATTFVYDLVDRHDA
ncbi:GNAT family N-acetyltransferase [Qipengyuania thermophila]|uniref:GNAT family N-acetyltransferase n=1 Tax=Qipengyuania thermophila TaxID=2509361 RepID=UPI001F40DFA5|nr:GNAT family N-acetyltransferase [Qipengyuania thermophila]